MEIWDEGLVVNLQLTGPVTAEEFEPQIRIEDHLGTRYKLQAALAIGGRRLQLFSPSAPEGVRSLTVKAAEDGEVRQVVVFAVPATLMRGR